ncbi:MAG: amidohydrolase [Planctomycetia bacterium]|nr:amidohydrolase [Planctomycetia bacterium]
MKHGLLILLAALLIFSSAAARSNESAAKKEKSDTAQFLQKTVQSKAPEILDVSHSVWEYAELGYHEYKSAAKIISVLKSEGFQVEEQAGKIKTAFIARYGKGKPIIGLMAEYDALPNLGQAAGSAVKTPRSGNRDGHGCGHNTLGAGSVGAAIAVKEYLKAKGCSGTIILFGTPAEETGYGKAFMVKAGCFKGTDAVFAWHPSSRNSAVQYDNNAYYRIVFTFHGVSAHAAGAPDSGRSAVDACELMNVGTNYLREHVPTSVRIHYAWTNPGGSAPNIIYDEAQLNYFVRAPQITQCGEILKRVVKIAEGAALMTGTKMEYKVLGGLNSLMINSVMATVLSDALLEMGPPDFDEADNALARQFLPKVNGKTDKTWVKNRALSKGLSEEEFLARPLNREVVPYNKKAAPPRGFASTDDSDVSWIIPLARLNMITGVEGTSTHTWEWTAQAGSSIGDKGTLAAARTLARACTILFEKPSLIEAAKKELQKKTGGKYISPIPDGITPENPLITD